MREAPQRKPSLLETTFRWTVVSGAERRMMGRECENVAKRYEMREALQRKPSLMEEGGAKRRVMGRECENCTSQ